MGRDVSTRPAAAAPSRISDGGHFCMLRRVPVQNHPTPGLADDNSITHDHRAIGLVAKVDRPLPHIKRTLNKGQSIGGLRLNNWTL